MGTRHFLTFGLIAVTSVLAVSGCVPGARSKLPFTADFTDTASGWSTDGTEAFERGYADGEYFIQVFNPSWFMWAHPGKVFDDVAVTTDLYAATSDKSGYAGVLCRHTDLDNFYYFAISADGYYAIFRRVDGSELQLISGDGRAVYSDAIRQGEQVNHVKAICAGTTLSFFANGELLETVTDTAHQRGDVGVGVASGSDGGVRFNFGNFEATEP